MHKKIKITKDNFKGRVILMLKDMAWKTFKNTGNIHTFLEFRKIKEIEQNLGEIDGNNQD